MSAGTLLHLGDTLLIVAGIALLIACQFRWRTLDPRGLLGLPLIVIALGLGYAAVGLVSGGHRPSAADAVVLPLEFVLVAITGAVMGRATHFRRRPTPGDDDNPDAGTWQYRLTRLGLVLWAVFVAVRVGSFVLGAHLGARLPETTGAILLSFGANRLVCGLVVRRRAPGPTATTTERSVKDSAVPS